jgi:hypothetical protein
VASPLAHLAMDGETAPRHGCRKARQSCWRAASTATNWYGREASAEPALPGAANDHEVDALCRRKAWARLLAKVHSIDVLASPRCGSRMSVIAVITDPAQIRRATGAALGIIDCLDRHGRGPPQLG